MCPQVRPDDGGDAKISINPRGAKIPANTVGFFIAQSAEEVKRFASNESADLELTFTLVFRAWFYCKSCHEKVRNENIIRKCKCRLSKWL